MAKLTIKHPDRLRKAIKWSIVQLAPFQRKQAEFAKEIAGNDYGEPRHKRTPLNLVDLYMQVTLAQVVGADPRYMVRTNNRDLRPYAKAFEMDLNATARDIKMAEQGRDVVWNALTGLGAGKCGMAEGKSVLIDGQEAIAGMHYFDSIPFEDWGHDMTAKRMDQWEWQGNRWWAPVEWVRANREYSATARNTVDGEQGSYPSGHEGESVKSALGLDENTSQGTYSPRMCLWDAYLPDEGVIVTLPLEEGGPIYKVVEFDRESESPYFKLPFSRIPGMPMPVPPMAPLFALHKAVNAMARKILRRAERSKSIGLYVGMDKEAAKRINDASDGDSILGGDGGDPFKFHESGKLDPQMMATLIQFNNWFSYFAGGLNLGGGLAPMSDTLGQDEILMQAANERRDDRRRQTVAFFRDVGRSLARYRWDDPLAKRTMYKPLPGSDGMGVTVTWGPEMRVGNFEDYQIELYPYSMADAGPQAKLTALRTILAEIIMPALPSIEAQGRTADWGRVMEMVEEWSQIDGIGDILGEAIPPMYDPASGAGDGMGGMGGETINVGAGAPGQQELDAGVAESAMQASGAGASYGAEQ